MKPGKYLVIDKDTTSTKGLMYHSLRLTYRKGKSPLVKITKQEPRFRTRYDARKFIEEQSTPDVMRSGNLTDPPSFRIVKDG
jgi:hypothetical protein